jgi:hypothetical protein
LVKGNFDITTFSVNRPASFGVLGVDAINNLGFIVAYEQTAAFQTQGYLRLPFKAVLNLQDPKDHSGTYTESTGINDLGTVVGIYHDTANSQYSGFFYVAGTFFTYNVPGLPVNWETDVLGINDEGDFCGDYRRSTDNFYPIPYVNHRGTVTPFPIAGATFAECLSLNNFGWSAGLSD